VSTNPADISADIPADTPAALPLTFDLDRAWDLHPRVEIRPERFGALLYSFDTRRLSFLRSRELLAVVQALATAPTVRDACAAVGIPGDQLPTYRAALARLAETAMITPRESD
jgi:putative mycofactocin binding protein MftB